MTNRVVKALLIMSFLLSMGMIPAWAQVGDPGVEAEVPFDFTVGNTTLPAGKYEIRTVTEYSPSVLQIRSEDGHASIMFNTGSVEANRTRSKSVLVFNKYGENYFLHQIWVAGEQTGNEIGKSRTEQRIEREGGSPESQSIDARELSNQASA